MQDGKKIPDLFGDLVRQVSTLFRKEIQLARAETQEKIHQATGAAVAMVMGAVVLLAGFLMLLHAAVAWLEELGLDIEWGALLVGGVVTLIGAIMLQRGLANVKAANLKPERTVEQLHRDAESAREHVR